MPTESQPALQCMRCGQAIVEPRDAFIPGQQLETTDEATLPALVQCASCTRIVGGHVLFLPLAVCREVMHVCRLHGCSRAAAMALVSSLANFPAYC